VRHRHDWRDSVSLIQMARVTEDKRAVVNMAMGCNTVYFVQTSQHFIRTYLSKHTALRPKIPYRDTVRPENNKAHSTEHPLSPNGKKFIDVRGLLISQRLCV
jgi:hypothetical protein